MNPMVDGQQEETRLFLCWEEAKDDQRLMSSSPRWAALVELGSSPIPSVGPRRRYATVG